MSIYSGIATSVLETRLAEAQTALHELSVGKKVTTLSLGDKRLSFSNAPDQISRLKAYISQIQLQISINQGNTTSSGITAVASWIR
jgi:hypothetical protein